MSASRSISGRALGSPAIYARTMVSLCQAAGHEVWTGDTSPTSVTVYGRRRDNDNDNDNDMVEESTWTIKRATAAGFTSNAKYAKQPEEMLYAKAPTTVCRRAFADVLEGIPYTVEDLELEPIQVESKRVDRRRRVRRRLAHHGTVREEVHRRGRRAGGCIITVRSAS